MDLYDPFLNALVVFLVFLSYPSPSVNAFGRLYVPNTSHVDPSCVYLKHTAVFSALKCVSGPVLVFQLVQAVAVIFQA